MPKKQRYEETSQKICNACGKNIYTHEMEAQETARYREHEETNVQLQWYPCPYGHGWHLTSGN